MVACPICCHWMEDEPDARCLRCRSRADPFGTLGMPAAPPRFAESDARPGWPRPARDTPAVAEVARVASVGLETIGQPTWPRGARPAPPRPDSRHAIQVRRGGRWVELDGPAAGALTLRRRGPAGPGTGLLARFE